ncbi:MAG: hypothetical protein RR052_04590 [Oscillospiraceae bacterium]
MIRKANISELSQVKNIVTIASHCNEEVGVHDECGAIADAKSILGLMSLDYTKPVCIVSENTNALESIMRAIS